MKNGEEIKSKVTEIGTTEIKYKKFDNPDGPLIVIPRADVLMIKYENGTKDVINSDYKPAKIKGDKYTEDKKYRALIYAGIAIPVGAFASSKDDNESGFANAGGTIGHEGDIHLSGNSVYFSYNSNFTVNPFELNYSIQTIDPFNGQPYIQQINYSSAYLSFYMMAGFKFKSMPDVTRYYGLVMGGICALAMSDADDNTYSKGGFAVEAGGGVEIKNHFNIGLRYFYSNTKNTDNYNNYYPNSFRDEQKVGILQINFGYQF
jgi:hypothetical protein